jgi:hypothetical protein
MTHEELIAVSADPRALDPVTIRQVLREYRIKNTKEDAALTFFLDCVTVRSLLARGEHARANLCATQLGYSLEDFQHHHISTDTGLPQERKNP